MLFDDSRWSAAVFRDDRLRHEVKACLIACLPYFNDSGILEKSPKTIQAELELPPDHMESAMDSRWISRSSRGVRANCPESSVQVYDNSEVGAEVSR